MKTRRDLFFFFFLLSFLIPFIFQRSIFPFYRFGMFAEAPKQTVQHEAFKVLVSEKGKLKDFDAKSVGLYPSVFNQLLRNYYYRNEAREFLQIISADDTKHTFYFLRYSSDSASAVLDETFNDVDTVAHFTPIPAAF